MRDSLSSFIHALRSLGRSAARIHDSSSRDAVSFSSARTMKCFPSWRCASTIQIVCSRQATVDTQPKLQPRLVRLSVMISQYRSRRFTSPHPLLLAAVTSVAAVEPATDVELTTDSTVADELKELNDRTIIKTHVSLNSGINSKTVQKRRCGRYRNYGRHE